jgi:hypothetical protein
MREREQVVRDFEAHFIPRCHQNIHHSQNTLSTIGNDVKRNYRFQITLPSTFTTLITLPRPIGDVFCSFSFISVDSKTNSDNLRGNLPKDQYSLSPPTIEIVCEEMILLVKEGMISKANNLSYLQGSRWTVH